ncbi:cytochrome c biogenesis protein CcsA [Maridesulfovibrio sp.]|uniref:cytochrome c biogenesis protein CcsA n=1 Tax=Maridesulfovibrio sp. TaxID=2795000 RepID=UPI0029F5C6C7|nr:cytochrome c biogenesis protein CcsA [Maridesulfovibrio sp.]
MNIAIAALLAGVALCAGQYLIWMYAPIEMTMGLVQKIFYVHMPMAAWAMISFFVVFLASAAYLLKRDIKFDYIAGAAAEIGVVFSGLALITGSIWGRAAWNVWWTWDPRLTTTLIMWFVYAAYLVLRTSPMSAERRSLVCAVLGVVAFVDVPLVFYSARLWRSVHPNVIGAKGGGMEPEMLTTLLVNIVAFGLFWLALLAVRYKQVRLSGELDAKMVWDQD